MEGREKTFRIAHVEPFRGEIRGAGTKAAKKQPKLSLETAKGTPIELPLLLNKTNAAVIARLYGNNPFKWVGKYITLFPSTTDSPQGTVDCIRVRPQVPQSKTKAGAGAVAQSSDSQPAPAADYEREPGDDDEPPPDIELPTQPESMQ